MAEHTWELAKRMIAERDAAIVTLRDQKARAEADLAAMRVALEKTIARIKDTGPTTCFECEITLMESAAALAAGGTDEQG